MQHTASKALGQASAIHAAVPTLLQQAVTARSAACQGVHTFRQVPEEHRH